MMPKNKTTIIVGGLAAVVLAAIGIGLSIYVVQDSRDELGGQAKDDPLQVAGAKIAIENRFPEAQLTFGDAKVHWDGDIPSVCGKVDIVQPQDMFDGPERYAFSDGELTVEEADGTDAVDQKWSDVCAG
jgi:hypothetical protein